MPATSATPEPVTRFLAAGWIAVVGASRDRSQPGNAIYRRLRHAGLPVVAVNPRATEIEGDPCAADLGALAQAPAAALVATPPAAAMEIVRQCVEYGIRHVWFHRSFGAGSVAPEAIALCREHGIEFIEGGCPMMFCGQVDPFHRCLRWWLQRTGRAPR